MVPIKLLFETIGSLRGLPWWRFRYAVRLPDAVDVAQAEVAANVAQAEDAVDAAQACTCAM